MKLLTDLQKGKIIMDKKEMSEYNKKYYEKNKVKILASRKASKSKPYNYLTEAYRRASREYYRRKKEKMTIEEHESILAKRREAYKRKKVKEIE